MTGLPAPSHRYHAKAIPETWACVLGPGDVADAPGPHYSYVTSGHETRNEAVRYARDVHAAVRLVGLIRFGIGPDGDGYAEWVDVP